MRLWQVSVFVGYFVATKLLHVDFRIYMALILAVGLLFKAEESSSWRPVRTDKVFTLLAIVPLAFALFVVDSLFL